MGIRGRLLEVENSSRGSSGTSSRADSGQHPHLQTLEDARDYFSKRYRTSKIAIWIGPDRERYYLSSSDGSPGIAGGSGPMSVFSSLPVSDEKFRKKVCRSIEKLQAKLGV